MMAVICGMPMALITALLRKTRPKSSVSGKTSSCSGQKNAGGIDQIDRRDAILDGDVLRANHFLRGHREERAGLHRGVVGDDHHAAPGDVAEAGNGAGGGRAAPFLVHFVGGVEAQLEEFRAGIDQFGDALARGEAAFLVLRFDGFCAAALADLFLFVLDFGEAVDHASGWFFSEESRGFGSMTLRGRASPWKRSSAAESFVAPLKCVQAPCGKWRSTRWRMKSTMDWVVVPGRKIFGDARFLERGNVGFGNDAADQHGHVGHALGVQQFHQARADRVVRAGKNREADDVDVFLHGGRGDHFGRLAQAGVDHFHAGVAQGARDHFGAAVVAVQAGLGDQHPYLFLGMQIQEYCKMRRQKVGYARSRTSTDTFARSVLHSFSFR